MKPENHTLFWVYAYSKDRIVGYNFDTTTQLDEARRMLTASQRGDGSST